MSTEASIWSSETVRARTEAAAILATHETPSTADEMREYVERPELEAALEEFLHAPPSKSGKYLVVHGARGAGKSTLASHVLSKTGSGSVVVNATGKPFSIASSDLDSLVINKALRHAATLKRVKHVPLLASPGQLADRLMLAAHTRRHDSKQADEEEWRPTIVVEVDSPLLIESVCAQLKQLTHDRPLCHGIIVLDDSASVAALPDDRARQTFLRVGNFSREEAIAALNKTFETLPSEAVNDAVKADVKELVLPLTTMPSYLGDLEDKLRGSKSDAEVRSRCQAWASEFEAAALRDVRGTLTLDSKVDSAALEDCMFPVRDLIIELIDADAPVKLPTAKYFVEATQFASKIRCSRAAEATFDVDLVAGTVGFATGAHRKAAAELFPAPPP